ncbi:hypothetical protein [Prochlorococcus marinus]
MKGLNVLVHHAYPSQQQRWQEEQLLCVTTSIPPCLIRTAKTVNALGDP